MWKKFLITNTFKNLIKSFFVVSFSTRQQSNVSSIVNVYDPLVYGHIRFAILLVCDQIRAILIAHIFIYGCRWIVKENVYLVFNFSYINLIEQMWQISPITSLSALIWGSILHLSHNGLQISPTSSFIDILQHSHREITGAHIHQ